MWMTETMLELRTFAQSDIILNQHSPQKLKLIRRNEF
jgi:hypothetical protein